MPNKRDTKKRQIGLWIDHELLAKLDQLAAGQNRSRSNLIETILKQSTGAHGLSDKNNAPHQPEDDVYMLFMSNDITGEELKAWRKEEKLTQSELGDMVGMDKYAITNIERGKRGISESEQRLLKLLFRGKMPFVSSTDE